MNKLFIAVCNSQDFVPSAFHWSWERMAKPDNYRKERFTHSYGVIRNNQAVDMFLASDCDMFTFMDIDQKYPENYLTIMLPLAYRYKVIGPLIYDKWRVHNFNPLMFDENRYPFLSFPSGEAYTGIVEKKYAHNNMFYAREVLERIPPPWYEFNLNERGTNRNESQDFLMNDKVRKAGYKVYVNTDMEVQHLVMMPVDTRLHNLWNQKL